jgi:heme-degrading monooxygenase HmoA
MKTPKIPYYAVIFTSILTDNQDGYSAVSDQLLDFAKDQQGFLGIESARSGLGITVSYWTDLEAIKSWKQQIDHKKAQEKGMSDWYQEYQVRIARVERDYSWKSK